MSVATQHSPFAVGTKRLFESEENEDRLQRLDSTAASHKRYRARGSPNDRCAGDQAQAAYRVSHATLTALRGLFPEMSDKVIADVLAEYGDNIDAAIKHLTDLRLSAAALGGATPQQAAAAVEQQQQQVQQQQEQQAQVTAQQAGGAEAAAGPSAAAAATANGGPRSADEWVDAVVAEMAAASDMADARARASKVLQAFEQAAVEHSKQLATPAEVRSQLADAQRENQLLKRAVAIQNTRLQELSGKEAEVAQLRQMLDGFQQRVHALEVQNYSLALHLKQATDGKDTMAAGGFPKNPDVF